MTIKKYLIIFYSLFIPLLFLPLFKSSVDTSGFMGGFALATYYLGLGGIIVTIASLIDIFITFKFINSNFNKNKNEPINKIFILKFLLISYLLSYFITTILRLFNLSVQSSYSSYIPYLFYPLLIPICLFFIKKENINRKTIFFTILFNFILAVVLPAISGLRQIPYMQIEFWFVLALFRFIILRLPLFCITFVLLKRNSQKKLH